MLVAVRFCKIILMWSLLLWGCSVARQEVKRVRSPDGRVEAVLIQTNAGATTGFGFEVFLVPTGANPKTGSELFRADRVVNLDLHWRESMVLEIAYDQGRIFHFSNFWNSADLDNFRYVVEV